MNAKSIHIKDLHRDNISQNTALILASIGELEIKNGLELLKEDIKLVVWEILCNVVQHGSLPSHIPLHVCITEKKACIELTFNPYSYIGFNWGEKKEAPYPSWDNPSGRGLFIVQQVCDFFCDSEGDTVKSVFYFENYK